MREEKRHLQRRNIWDKKNERLKGLNILLNMDQKDRSILDDEPEEESPDKPKARDYER